MDNNVISFDETGHQQQQLIKQFQQALSDVNFTLRKSKENVYQKPWSIVIGHQQAGKKTLFKQAQLNLQKSIHVDGGIEIIITQQCVYFVLPASLIAEENASLLLSIAQNIKAHRREKAFDSIAVVSNIQCLSTDNTQHIQQLKQSINTLTQMINVTVPVYITFTHTDLIAGFTDYFGELSRDERQQAWGLVIPDNCAKEELSELVEKRFNNFLQRLHQLQISRLHATRSREKRCLINEFPIQMEQIRQHCQQFMATLFDQSLKQANPRGIFFASSVQQGEVSDSLSEKISDSCALTLAKSQQHPQSQRAFFIHEIFNNIIANDYFHSRGHQSFLNQHKIIKRLAIGGAGLTMVLVSAVLSVNYFQAQQYLQLTQASLQQLTQEAAETHTQPLPSSVSDLANIGRAHETLTAEKAPLMLRFPNNHLSAIQDKSEKAYRHNISQYFLPRLKQLIEDELSQTQLTPGENFNALKAYLMLKDPKHADLDFLKPYFLELLQKQTVTDSSTIDKQLSMLLDALAKQFPSSKVNSTLVKQARANLNAYPKPYLGYLMIKENVKYKDIKCQTELFGQVTIPYAFTHQGFSDIYPNAIAEVSYLLANHHWVLGNGSDKNASREQSALTEQITKLYGNEYVTWWNLLVRKLKPVAITDFQQASDTFHALGQQHSSLQSFIAEIANNTQSMNNNDNVAQYFNQHIANKLTGLSQLQAVDIQRLNHDFVYLAKYFKQIVQARDPAAEALKRTKQRFIFQMNNDALSTFFNSIHTYPQPMKAWLAQLGLQSWQLMMDQSSLTLNKTWQAIVYREYQRNIQQRYPIQAQSKSDISMINFSHFFAPKGTLNNYFVENIQPFMDTTQAQWRLKEVDGLTLKLPQQLLSQLERANIIRAMFFEANSDKPVVKFSIKSEDYDQHISAVAVEVNGQRFMDYQGNKNKLHFTWPGNDMLAATKFFLLDEDGNSREKTKVGPWSLFRILEEAEFSPTEDGKKYQLVMDFKPGRVSYLIESHKSLNPFIPDVINKFELPEKLTA